MVILTGDDAPNGVMKTAVSLPDELFDRAERAAAEMGVPRSNLYAHAIAEFLDRHESERTTARLDALYSELPTDRPVVHPGAVFSNVEW